MNGETLRPTTDEQARITQDITLFVNRLKQWVNDNVSGDEDKQISCIQFANDTLRIISANLQVNGNLHDVDIALLSREYPDVNDYIVGQLIAKVEPQIYQQDETRRRWEPTIIKGLWLRFHPTVRPHIVGLHDIPASLHDTV